MGFNLTQVTNENIPVNVLGNMVKVVREEPFSSSGRDIAPDAFWESETMDVSNVESLSVFNSLSTSTRYSIVVIWQTTEGNTLPVTTELIGDSGEKQANKHRLLTTMLAPRCKLRVTNHDTNTVRMGLSIYLNGKFPKEV